MPRIYRLSEGEFTIGHDKIFVPFNPGEDELSDRPTGSLLVEVQPFLVVKDAEVIVLDTGLGFSNKDGEQQIHHNIRLAGYEPEQVTKVLLSHLHKDHAGGVTYKDGNGTHQLTFPNATYYVHKQEAGYAREKGAPSYMTEEIEPLLASGKVRWLEGESGNVDDNITFTLSGGHCPFHIVFLLQFGNEKIFFGGDEAPQLKQMKIKYVAKYDYDGKKAMMLREQYAEQGRSEGWQFLFYHDVQKPMAKL
jgi:glyoxylase-like metal-dependent hydrolase (beta-lactamase superfamily II)